jgi:hypothetical protein
LSVLRTSSNCNKRCAMTLYIGSKDLEILKLNQKSEFLT